MSSSWPSDVQREDRQEFTVLISLGGNGHPAFKIRWLTLYSNMFMFYLIKSWPEAQKEQKYWLRHSAKQNKTKPMSCLNQLIPFTLSSLPFLTHTPLLIYLKVAKMVNTAEGLILPLHTHTHTHTCSCVYPQQCAHRRIAMLANIKCVSGPESQSDPSFDTDAAVSPPEYTL